MRYEILTILVHIVAQINIVVITGTDNFMQ